MINTHNYVRARQHILKKNTSSKTRLPTWAEGEKKYFLFLAISWSDILCDIVEAGAMLNTQEAQHTPMLCCTALFGYVFFEKALLRRDY